MNPHPIRTSTGEQERRPVVTFYGDDFTGSTDALLQFHRFGLRGLLLLGLPDASRLAALAKEYDVIGVAGVSRSLPPEQMDAEVVPVLTAFRALNPAVVQYKICSTADSSPHLGSIGRAIELGRSVFGDVPVPVLVAQPDFGRYTVFGNHFAVENRLIHRLDRQPTMSRHPATPMTEADLTRHIAKQTDLLVGSFHVLNCRLPFQQAVAQYGAVLGLGPGAVVFDALLQEDLRRAAELMLAGQPQRPLFVVGSGGLSYGLADNLRGPVKNHRLSPFPTRSFGSAVLVVSGSCSARTAEQIRWALDRGWRGVHLDIDLLGDRHAGAAMLARARDVALSGLAQGESVVVYTALGPSPSSGRPAPSSDEQDGVGADEDRLASIASALAHLVRQALEHGATRRIVIAGGDTSGRVTRLIGVDSLSIDSTLGNNAVICRAMSRDPVVDGIGILLKGGQVGDVNLFDDIRQLPGTGEVRT
jgi:uncharacterized protein YgbK (DUF1537 family)